MKLRTGPALLFLVLAPAMALLVIYSKLEQLNFTSNKKTLKVWYSMPKKITKETQLLFVMHGVKRNG